MNPRRVIATLGAAVVFGTAIAPSSAANAGGPPSASAPSAVVTTVAASTSDQAGLDSIWERAKRACKRWTKWKWPRRALGRNVARQVPGTNTWLAGGERRDAATPPRYAYGIAPLQHADQQVPPEDGVSPYNYGERHWGVAQQHIQPPPSYLDALMTDPDDDWVAPAPPYVEVVENGQNLGRTDCG
ncbi:hypothetical protein [Nonomuraea lactucae]|uniref:hypothetical protein n=1 Tax=Nonomuraea lactucae TaxID=2249762 RepID=UPI0013B35F6F|nr:hypothetical protein [Nonomuraea lactucae]